MNTDNNEKKATVSNDGIKLQGHLGLMQLVLIGIAYMSPICIYLYYGMMTPMTGGMYALTILVTGAVMTLTALSYGKMSREIPAAGSVYTYVERSMNPYLGFVAGWGIIADYLLLPMISYLSFGLYLNALIPAVPTWIWILLGIVIVTICSCRGVTVMAALNTVITAIPIVFVAVAIIFVVIYVAGGGGSGTFFDMTAFYNPELFDAGSVVAASAILCCGFVGFDAISTMSEEAKEPKKNIPKAIVLTCAGTAIIYIIMGYLLQLAWPNGYAEIQDPNTGILELFVVIGQPWLATALSIINILTALACSLSGNSAVSRIFYGMGRDGFLPKSFFGYLHPKWHTPVKNILLTSVLGLSAIIFADDLQSAVSLISFGALVGFTFVNISVIALFFFKKKERNGIKIFTGLIVPAIAAICCIYLLFGLAVQAKILGGCWLVLGIIYLAVKTKGFRKYPEGLTLE